MTDPSLNGNGAALPESTEQTGEVDAILGYLMDGMERLAEQVRPAPVELDAEQRNRLVNLYLTRYAIESGIPVQAALRINGFDVDITEQPAPPAQAEPTSEDTSSNEDEPSADTRALRAIFEDIKVMLEQDNENITPNDPAPSDEAGPEYSPADGEAQGEQGVHSTDGEADATSSAQPTSQSRNPQRHRTRGREVRNVGHDPGGADVQGQSDEAV